LSPKSAYQNDSLRWDVVTPNPLIEEESRPVYNCDNERLSWSTKFLFFQKFVKFKVPLLQ